MAEAMTPYDIIINKEMISIRDTLAELGWENIPGRVTFQKKNEPYEISLVVVDAGYIPAACKMGGIDWGGGTEDPAVYAVARIPQEKFMNKLMGQLKYLNEIRIHEDPFKAGIVPDKKRISIYYSPDGPGTTGKTTWPFTLHALGPQIGLGMVDSEGCVYPVGALSDAGDISEVFENPKIDISVETINAAIDNYETALRQLPSIAQTQGIRYITPEEGRGEFGRGSVAAQFDDPNDKREALIKLLAFGVDTEGALAATGHPFLVGRRHSPDYNIIEGALDGGRPADEFGLRFVPTSAETLGDEISKLISVMLKEHKKYPPQPAVGLEIEFHPPGTNVSTIEVPPILYV